MHPAQLRVLPYARSAPDRNKARSHAPVKEHCTRSERVQCLLMGCTAPSVTSKNTELPEWRTPKDPQGLALVPGGGGRAWPGFETTRRAKLAARTASGRAAAPRHQQRRQAREHKLRGRQAGGPSGRLAAQTPSRQLAARTPSGRAERAGRRHQAPTRRTRAYNEAGTRRAKQRRGPRPRETVRPGGPP